MDLSFLDKIGFDLEVAIANLINFLLIFIVFKLFFYKPIVKTLEARKQRIKQGLQDAEDALRQLKDAEKTKTAIISDAKKEAEQLRKDAKQFADKVKAQAELEGADVALQMKQEARKDIAQERTKMEQEVEAKMTSLVAALSEKAIVEKQ